MLGDIMALSTVMNSIGLDVGHTNDISDTVRISSSQDRNPSESEDGKVAARLPSINQRMALELDAKDSMTDSDSDQQQQQQPLFNSSSSSSSSSSSLNKNHLGLCHSNPALRVSSLPLQHIQDVKKSSKAPSLNGPRGRGGHRSITAARQRFLLEKAAKQQEKKQATDMFSKHTTHSQISENPPPQIPIHSLNHSSTIAFRTHRVQNPWTTREHLYIRVYGLPDSTTTRDLWTSFKHEGQIAHIRLFEDAKGFRDGGAIIKFSPPPARNFWAFGRCSIQLVGGNTVSVRVYAEHPHRLVLPVHPKSQYPETMTMHAESVDFGVMFDQSTMMNMRTVLPTREKGIRLRMDMFHKELSVEFPMHIVDPRTTSNQSNMQRGKYDRTELFQFRIPFTQLKVIHRLVGQGQKLTLLISMETPPKFFKQLDPSKSHDDTAVTWGDSDSWYRQTDLVYVPNGLRKASLTWRKTSPIIDLGNWTTYRLVFNNPMNSLPQFDQMRKALRDYNIEIVPFPNFKITSRRDAPVWKLIDLHLDKRSNRGTGLEEMIYTSKPRMAFEVRYQLEVCLSQGFLNEHNLSENFVRTLMDMNIRQAQDILEYIANHGNRVYDPMPLVQTMDGDVSLSRTKIPSYCAYIRSATITPTTVHFQTPVAETSNRVIRQYSQHADRFLRVRFTEEKTEGKIYTTHKDTMNEVFTRVKRVLTNGIKIGDRTYEFLACGNAQFREHGAYFFAPLPNLTTEKIRKWMGMFSDIKTVALYASRLGQCFSTTRAIHGARATILEIPDIKRNGYNFTDGVGRISPFLAHLAASELGILQHSQQPPSVFQIRVGGCKGVLAVSPNSVGRQIHIRKSQYKFPAKHEGLEIIRWSQYAFANLNRQLILILSALGVPDQVFAQKLQMQLSRLERAMTDEMVALSILQKEIDHNQMTLTVASMILDGFQATGEPFLTSLLQLWRAWSIKHLKEKARITIGAGALLLGCVDETGILRGHFDEFPQSPANASNDEKARYVPQVFVQISNNSDVKPEVILGPMLLARNPSLHPGDVRVVCGVDVPQLHHLKDVVVLPQTGDRDVAGMCSGGDLDGDDFIVIWDLDLLPTEWNHEPMDYSRPPMEQPNENIGIDDLTTFFVTYMKHDTLPAIAHAHTANADYLEEGVKDAKCLKLANLHSMAVDYVKTGQPARMTRDLQPPKWPHFMEKIGKKQHQVYRSKKVLGQLYDQVERIDFVPAFTAPFDTRILHAYILDESILRSAREIKKEYDAHMRRIMAQQEIKTEFEVWSTFVLQHSSTSNAFKYHEQIGEISLALKDQFRLICHERAGGKDFEHIGPFAAAMYEVTAREMDAAVEECHRFQIVGGQPRPLREITPSTMPLMSFPWLFQNVLGKIAKSNTPKALSTFSTQGVIGSEAAGLPGQMKAPQSKRGRVGPRILDSEDYLVTSKGTTHPGQMLELFGRSGESSERKEPAEAGYIPTGSVSVKSSNSSMGTSIERSSSVNKRSIDGSSSSSPERLARKPHEDGSYNAEVPVSYLPESGNRLFSQGGKEVPGLAENQHTAALNRAVFERTHVDDKALSVKYEYAIPRGYDRPLSSKLMTDLSARSQEPGSLILRSSQSEDRSTLEGTSMAEEENPARISHLSEIEVSDDVKVDEKTENTIEKKGNDYDVDNQIDYISDSDADLDEVTLSLKARLLDQLATITGDDSVSRSIAIDDSPVAIKESTDLELDRFRSASGPVSLIPGSQAQERE